MLNYQEESCKLSLKEGIEEYRKYLKTNNRHVLGENCSEDEKMVLFFFLQIFLKRKSQTSEKTST
jgi:hypothetical protein